MTRDGDYGVVHLAIVVGTVVLPIVPREVVATPADITMMVTVAIVIRLLWI